MAKGAEAKRRCPICGKPPQDEFRPFCSQRCTDVDLNRWLSGAYRVETEEKPKDGNGGEEPPKE